MEGVLVPENQKHFPRFSTLVPQQCTLIDDDILVTITIPMIKKA
jgi:hypothetical protein